MGNWPNGRLKSLRRLDWETRLDRLQGETGTSRLNETPDASIASIASNHWHLVVEGPWSGRKKWHRVGLGVPPQRAGKQLAARRRSPGSIAVTTHSWEAPNHSFGFILGSRTTDLTSRLCRSPRRPESVCSRPVPIPCCPFLVPSPSPSLPFRFPPCRLSAQQPSFAPPSEQQPRLAPPYPRSTVPTTSLPLPSQLPKSSPLTAAIVAQWLPRLSPRSRSRTPSSSSMAMR